MFGSIVKLSFYFEGVGGRIYFYLGLVMMKSIAMKFVCTKNTNAEGSLSMEKNNLFVK